MVLYAAKKDRINWISKSRDINKNVFILQVLD